MKPPPFEYHRVDTVDETVALLADEGDDAKILAGGQSLVPMLNLRLANPGVLVDVGRVPLRSFSIDGGHVHVDALVTHRVLEGDPALAAELPLIALAAAQVGHAAIRNRGTIGGSLAHADPAAELAAAALALDAAVVVASTRGIRVTPVADFLHGPFTTSLESDEMVTGVQIPRHADRCVAFEEMAIRAGDFAVAAVAAAARRAADGTLSDVRIALGGVAGTAIRAREAEALLNQARFDPGRLRQAALMAAAATSPSTDIHGTAEYRRGLVVPLVERAVRAITNGGVTVSGASA